MLIAVVPHDDDRHVQPGGERGGLLHRRRDRICRVLPTQAHLAANQGSSGNLLSNRSMLLRPICRIVDLQRVRLASDQLQRHRSGSQGDARIIDE